MVGTLLLAAPAWSAPAETDDASQRLYLHYCSSCHGTTGKGDGALAPILDVSPSDLTQIAAKNGNVFPFLDVLRTIDGRKPLGAHGSPGMPVWGEVFLADPKAPLGEQLAAAGKLLLITQYLATLQQASPAAAP